MHVLYHRQCAYALEDNGLSDWMSRHFFTIGFMLSANLPLHLQLDLALRDRWVWNGRHHERTAYFACSRLCHSTIRLGYRRDNS